MCRCPPIKYNRNILFVIYLRYPKHTTRRLITSCFKPSVRKTSSIADTISIEITVKQLTEPYKHELIELGMCHKKAWRTPPKPKLFAWSLTLQCTIPSSRGCSTANRICPQVYCTPLSLEPFYAMGIIYKSSTKARPLHTSGVISAWVSYPNTLRQGIRLRADSSFNLSSDCYGLQHSFMCCYPTFLRYDILNFLFICSNIAIWLLSYRIFNA